MLQRGDLVRITRRGERKNELAMVMSVSSAAGTRTIWKVFVFAKEKPFYYRQGDLEKLAENKE